MSCPSFDCDLLEEIEARVLTLVWYLSRRPIDVIHAVLIVVMSEGLNFDFAHSGYVETDVIDTVTQMVLTRMDAAESNQCLTWRRCYSCGRLTISGLPLRDPNCPHIACSLLCHHQLSDKWVNIRAFLRCMDDIAEGSHPATLAGITTYAVTGANEAVARANKAVVDGISDGSAEAGGIVADSLATSCQSTHSSVVDASSCAARGSDDSLDFAEGDSLESAEGCVLHLDT